VLRVGLTGGLGSGKSTVAAMLAAHGAYVLSADDLARSLMQPGQAVFDAIVKRFGPGVVCVDGTLDRPALARIAFADGRVEELNAIVHPATIGLQSELTGVIFAKDPKAFVVVESALIFETKHANSWRERFDCLVLVTAPEELKIARFCARSGDGDHAGLEAEARRRLAKMIPDGEKLGQVDFVIRNDGSLSGLKTQVEALWASLQRRASAL
jgi:dephospho-CoA kinase